jgi:uncharacterized membrane protein YjgN (DUF898 family)
MTLTASNTQSSNLLSYQGKFGPLALIWVKNLILSIITLGLYRPWAKTNYRKYCYHSFVIAGDKPEYHGTGGELFKGMVKANMLMMLLYILFIIPAIFLFKSGSPDAEVYKGLVFIPIFGIISFLARYSALRYRLTRTKWRGMKGSLRGNIKHYVFFRIKRFFINILTLRLAVGRSAILDMDYLFNNAYIGNRKFEFSADRKQLDKINLITLLLAIPTIGISRYWYKAALLNVKYNNLKIAGLKFSANFTGGHLAMVSMGYTLLMLITFLLASPLVIHRTMKYFASHVRIEGNAEPIMADATQAGGNLGEGTVDETDYGGIDLDYGLI